MVTIPFVKALSPKEVSVNKLTEIPGFVIEAFNNLLKIEYHPRAGQALLKKGDLISEIMRLAPYDVTLDEIFKYRYLDVEGVFALKGWQVRFISPNENDSSADYFEFSPRRGWSE